MDAAQQLEGAKRRIEALELDNDRLRERIAMLETETGYRLVAPIELGLTASEARVFGVLMEREAATKPAIMTALYANRPDADEAEIKIVDVFVCKLRKKLKPFDIPIETIWGNGYRMTPATKDLVRAMMAPPNQAAPDAAQPGDAA